MGIPFEAIPAEVDESFDVETEPHAVAVALAQRKARKVAQRHPERFVLGADTIVVLGARVLGKPADRGEARRMLAGLSGSRHCVITGMCLIEPGRGERLAHETSWVSMRSLSEDEIETYLDSGEWEGKAGAYAIQETADRFVSKLEGSFDNVVGLPTELVRRLLAQTAFGR